MKTSLLVATLVGAALLTSTFSPLLRQKPGLKSVFGAVLGIAVVPAMLGGFLYFNGAFQQFVYCAIKHNIVASSPSTHRPVLPFIGFALVLGVLYFGARVLFRKAPDKATGTRRALVLLQTGIFLAVIEILWPVVTRQDYLPAYPLAAMLLTPLLLTGSGWIGHQFGLKGSISGTVALFGVEIIWLFLGRPITFNGTTCEVHLLSDVLRLTEPGEYVMNYKGEAVFRPRPFFYVLEPFTRDRLKLGLLKDEIPERLMATRTCVTMSLTRRMPKLAERFILENYIPVGQLRVAGKQLGTVPKGGSLKFEVKIPAIYALLAGTAAADGVLDGTALDGPRWLESGIHELKTPNESPITLIWSRAVERGFLPSPPGYQPERVGSEF